jgi:methylmalonyl-CoA mutase N-terminal domain/subunit
MVNQGSRRVVGLNCYQAEEAEETQIFQTDAEVERLAIERIQALRADRDPVRHEKAMAAFTKAMTAFAESEIKDLGSCDIIETAIDGSRADASNGELMGVMKDVLGWSGPHEY